MHLRLNWDALTEVAVATVLKTKWASTRPTAMPMKISPIKEMPFTGWNPNGRHALEAASGWNLNRQPLEAVSKQCAGGSITESSWQAMCMVVPKRASAGNIWQAVCQVGKR